MLIRGNSFNVSSPFNFKILADEVKEDSLLNLAPTFFFEETLEISNTGEEKEIKEKELDKEKLEDEKTKDFDVVDESSKAPEPDHQNKEDILSDYERKAWEEYVGNYWDK